MEFYVGIGELRVARAPGIVITRGLGSCVGVVLYDVSQSVGGLAHVMLPSSTDFTNYVNPYKFADLAVPALYEQLHLIGARTLRAKLAGGAKMFTTASDRVEFDIGRRNIERVRAMLRQLSVPIVCEDVGGTVGRTVTLDTSTGMVKVKSIGRGEQLL